MISRIEKTPDRPSLREASALEIALDLARRGFSVKPQLPGAKKPSISWKPFQDVAPVPSRISNWFKEFPDAGIALVLGPAFGLFVVDVDGEEAHHALLGRLGTVPEAPTVLSGSLKPHRYHLYFRHPAVATWPPTIPGIRNWSSGAIAVSWSPRRHSTSRAIVIAGPKDGRSTRCPYPTCPSPSSRPSPPGECPARRLVR